jgi:hypothetical protein
MRRTPQKFAKKKMQAGKRSGFSFGKNVEMMSSMAASNSPFPAHAGRETAGVAPGRHFSRVKRRLLP